MYKWAHICRHLGLYDPTYIKEMLNSSLSQFQPKLFIGHSVSLPAAHKSIKKHLLSTDPIATAAHIRWNISLHTHILWLTTRDICLALCTPPHRILLFFCIFQAVFFSKKNLSSGECLAWALYMVPVSSIMFYMFSCAINVFVSVHSTSLWPLRFVFAKRFQTNITHVDFTTRELLNRWYARPKQSSDRICI